MVCKRGENMAKKNAKYTAKYICAEVEKYLAECKEKQLIPVVKDFCLSRDMCYDYIMQLRQEPKDGSETEQQRSDRESISQSINKIVQIKEVMLEREGLNGNYNSSMAIFALKQLGWTDRIQTQNDTNIHISLVEWEDDDSI